MTGVGIAPSGALCSSKSYALVDSIYITNHRNYLIIQSLTTKQDQLFFRISVPYKPTQKFSAGPPKAKRGHDVEYRNGFFR